MTGPVITAVLIRRGDPSRPAEYAALPDGSPPPVLLVLPDPWWATTVRAAPRGPPLVRVIAARYLLARQQPPATAGRAVYRYVYAGSEGVSPP